MEFSLKPSTLKVVSLDLFNAILTMSCSPFCSDIKFERESDVIFLSNR